MKELLNIYSYANSSERDMAKAIMWLILSGVFGVVPFFKSIIYLCVFMKRERQS
ncbi:hypothetical protein SAMN05446037_102545 [Anaerovirgula multivorans]|uniref:Uncharacterized protein n=1 Tax=Anaerovirgula multivorans TaxID=312168 RepID=A0A239I2I6_9FIRM|nr:hypothetical protein SAMN05446037_102545 [Anaerovirgula multivorans]